MGKSDVTARLDFLAKKFNISTEKLAENFGYKDTKSFASAKSRGRVLENDDVDKIKALIPEINLNWLFAGQGEMLISYAEGNSFEVNEDRPEYETKDPIYGAAMRIEEKMDEMYSILRRIEERLN